MKRDWGWPDEREEERLARRAWSAYGRGAHESEIWRPEVLPSGAPRQECERAHHELMGTYYGCVSEKHLRGYLDELAFRWGRRSRREAFEEALEGLVASQPLTYREIVARREPEGHALSIFEERAA